MVDRIDFERVPKERHNYDSSFESDVEARQERNSFVGLVKEKQKKEKVANKRQLEDELIREEGKLYRTKAVSMDAFSRHKEYINNYLLYYGGSRKDFQRDTSKDKTDIDIIRENHRFLWDGDDEDDQSWEKRLAKKYYDKLFKEYCISDLSRYKENKIGMRWRVEKEVIDGKGQFICGNKKCSETAGLRSWEVNFGYVEHGEKKNALVKMRLCPDCSYKLNYHHKRKEVVRRSKKSTVEDGSEGKNKKKKYSSEGDRSFEKAGSSKKPSKADDDKQTEGDRGDEEIWSKPVAVEEEKSREDEFDDYFADMLL